MNISNEMLNKSIDAANLNNPHLSNVNASSYSTMNNHCDYDSRSSSENDFEHLSKLSSSTSHTNLNNVNSMDSTCNKTATAVSKGELICVICGAAANGYNFDVITCESCKAFFRRNAFRPLNLFRCTNGNQCEITLITRKKCKKCRIMKCFKKGMRRDWIMSEKEREEKRKKIEQNRLKKGSNNALNDFTDNSNGADLQFIHSINSTAGFSPSNNMRCDIDNEDEEEMIPNHTIEQNKPIRRRRRRRRFSDANNFNNKSKDTNNNIENKSRNNLENNEYDDQSIEEMLNERNSINNLNMNIPVAMNSSLSSQNRNHESNYSLDPKIISKKMQLLQQQYPNRSISQHNYMSSNSNLGSNNMNMNKQAFNQIYSQQSLPTANYYHHHLQKQVTPISYSNTQEFMHSQFSPPKSLPTPSSSALFVNKPHHKSSLSNLSYESSSYNNNIEKNFCFKDSEANQNLPISITSLNNFLKSQNQLNIGYNSSRKPDQEYFEQGYGGFYEQQSLNNNTTTNNNNINNKIDDQHLNRIESLKTLNKNSENSFQNLSKPLANNPYAHLNSSPLANEGHDISHESEYHNNEKTSDNNNNNNSSCFKKRKREIINEISAKLVSKHSPNFTNQNQTDQEEVIEIKQEENDQSSIDKKENMTNVMDKIDGLNSIQGISLSRNTDSILSSFEHFSLMNLSSSSLHLSYDLLSHSGSITEIQKKQVHAIKEAYSRAIQLVKAQGSPDNSGDINTTINVTELGVRRIIFFFKLISDFRNLDHDLMVKLLKQNMMSLLQIHGVNSYNKEDNTFKEPDTDDTPFSAASLEAVYGLEIYNFSIGITRSLYDLCNNDMNFIKILLMIVVFDPMNDNLTSDEKKLVSRFQNKYITLIYAYMREKLGSPKSEMTFKSMIFEINKINILSNWFERTVVEKSNYEYVRPLMKEIFSFPSENIANNLSPMSNGSVRSVNSNATPIHVFKNGVRTPMSNMSYGDIYDKTPSTASSFVSDTPYSNNSSY